MATKIPDKLLLGLAKVSMSPSEWRVLMYAIARYYKGSIRAALEKLAHSEEAEAANILLRLVKDHKPRKVQPEDEIEIPEEVPTALPWDEK